MIQGIKTKNIKPKIRERMKHFTEELMKCPEVEGIVYLGGLANTEYKNFIDEFSDIDIGIFINGDRENLPDWLQPFSFYIPVDDDNEKESMMEVNLHQQLLKEEEQNEWADTKKEAYAYASEIIFDRNGKIANLIKEKTIMTPEHRKEFLAHLLSRINWSVKINPIRAIERGFEFNAEELLNQGMENMLDLVFVYNNRYPPHPKWRLAMIESLPYCPKEIKSKIGECMKIAEISEKDIRRRRGQILEIVLDIENRLKEEGIFREDEDYSDYEYIHWKPQKQLKETTIYDNMIEMFPKLSLEDKRVFKGLLCEFFIKNIEEIYEIPKSQLGEKYRKIIEKIVYQDPQSKKLIGDFVKGNIEKDMELVKMAEIALKRRKVQIIRNSDGKFIVNKMDERDEKEEDLISR